ncbi:MAG: hypothetical protein R3E39_20445 [Anaerolineae bacterium]
MSFDYVIKPRVIALILGILALYLAIQSVFGEYINTNVLHSQYNSLPSLILDEFSVNAEQTIPTWYQVMLLMSASVLLAIIARVKQRSQDQYGRYWTALEIIFLYLSIDEGAAIHELFSEPLHTALDTSGFLAFGWQIAAAPLLVIFGLLFLRFLFLLPRHIRNLIILAGLLYVGGAFMIDAVSASQLPASGALTLRYLVIGTLEEALEMAGQVTFIYALLSYMGDMGYGMNFRSLPSTRTAPSQDKISAHEPTLPDVIVTLKPQSKNSPLATVIRWLAPGVIVLVVVNVGVVYWALSQQADLVPVARNPVPIYEAIIEGFPQSEMMVTHMAGLFGSDNASAHDFAATLLSRYPNVMVVTVPSVQSSIFIAADSLPFDRQTLSDFLLSQGEIEFIIYDTPAVKQFVEKMNG